MSKLDELRAKVEAMTDAPWEAAECPPGWPIAEIATPSSVIAVPRRDATGIASLRNAAPALLDLVEAVDAMLTAVDAALPGELYHKRRAQAVDKLRAARRRLEEVT